MAHRCLAAAGLPGVPSTTLKDSLLKLDNMRIAHKLWGAIVVLLVAMALVAAFVLQRSSGIEQAATEAVSDMQGLTVLATRWKGLTEAAVVRGMASTVSSDPAVGDLFRANLANDTAVITKLREELGLRATTAEDKALLTEASVRGKALVGASKKASQLNTDGDWSTVAKWVNGEYKTAAIAYLAAIDDFVKLQQRKVDAAHAAADASRRQTLMLGSVAALIVLGFGMAVASVLVRSIRVPLQRSIEAARAISQGDLTQRIETTRTDEFGELMGALAHMNESLANIVSQVRTSTDSIGTASSEIASGNADLSSRTEQTASNLQQTASSMEQLTGTVRQSAASASSANELAGSATLVARRGGEVVERVVSTMQEINASSKKIADIIGTIDGIAFQTNILALNAAVEAARAGEQGRGFAVVASEVRALAQRSAEAAKEIKSLIGASVDKVELGARLVGNAGETMNEIVMSVQRVTDIIAEISSAASEQSDGIGQVSTAVSQLDQMTQQNAALVEESAAAAESLRSQAGKLSEVVGTFQLRAASARALTA
ncbi:methyl-accepting chemotaxis protein [soil metagenome]